jgi:nicotinate-nucleotide--dimethylbenzimidazole phosphoribosyltransferase
MVAAFCGDGAAVNVLARHAGADVIVVDVGVAADLDPAPGLLLRKVRHGTANLAHGPAMTVDEARQALDVGAEIASDAIAGGAAALVTGDMGIGNTTPSAALIAAFTGRPAADVTGRGTGVDDDTLRRKVGIVDRALAGLPLDDPLAVLATVGGLEIAALAGFLIAAATRRTPVVVDGVVALAGLVTAEALAPGTAEYCFAGHRSTEPGATAALDALGLTPLLDLEMRLGEGTGACLAVPVVQAAAKILREMATLDGAGVTPKG